MTQTGSHWETIPGTVTAENWPVSCGNSFPGIAPQEQAMGKKQRVLQVEPGRSQSCLMEAGFFPGVTLLVLEEWAKCCFSLPKRITRCQSVSLLVAARHFPLIPKSYLSFSEGYTFILAQVLSCFPPPPRVSLFFSPCCFMQAHPKKEDLSEQN